MGVENGSRQRRKGPFAIQASVPPRPVRVMPGLFEPCTPAMGAAGDGKAVDQLKFRGGWLSVLRGVPLRLGVAVKGL